jgi:hypothetical protein
MKIHSDKYSLTRVFVIMNLNTSIKYIYILVTYHYTDGDRYCIDLQCKENNSNSVNLENTKPKYTILFMKIADSNQPCSFSFFGK